MTRPTGTTGSLALEDEHGVVGAGRLRGRLGHRDAAGHPRLAEDVGGDRTARVAGRAGSRPRDGRSIRPSCVVRVDDGRSRGRGHGSESGRRRRRRHRSGRHCRSAFRGGPGRGRLGGRLRLGGGRLCGRAHGQIQARRTEWCEQRRRYGTWEYPECRRNVGGGRSGVRLHPALACREQGGGTGMVQEPLGRGAPEAMSGLRRPSPVGAGVT